MKGLRDFQSYLIEEEKSELTVEKYLRDAGKFLNWLGTEELTKSIQQEEYPL